MKVLLALLTLAVLLLHHDVWFWADRRLVGGILPVGLAYHVAYTLAVVGLMVLLVRYAWPEQLEASATEAAGEGDARG